MANHLESGGLAGKVHVSEATAKYLNDAYELEPADGHLRDGYIKQAGVDTFFIKQTEPSSSQRRTGRKWPPGQSGAQVNGQTKAANLAANSTSPIGVGQSSVTTAAAASADPDQQSKNRGASTVRLGAEQSGQATAAGNRCYNERVKSISEAITSEFDGSSLSERGDNDNSRQLAGARAASAANKKQASNETMAREKLPGGSNLGANNGSSATTTAINEQQRCRSALTSFVEEFEEDEDEEDDNGDGWKPEIPFKNLNKLDAKPLGESISAQILHLPPSTSKADPEQADKIGGSQAENGGQNDGAGGSAFGNTVQTATNGATRSMSSLLRNSFRRGDRGSTTTPTPTNDHQPKQVRSAENAVRAPLKRASALASLDKTRMAWSAAQIGSLPAPSNSVETPRGAGESCKRQLDVIRRSYYRSFHVKSRKSGPPKTSSSSVSHCDTPKARFIDQFTLSAIGRRQKRARIPPEAGGEIGEEAPLKPAQPASRSEDRRDGAQLSERGGSEKARKSSIICIRIIDDRNSDQNKSQMESANPAQSEPKLEAVSNRFVGCNKDSASKKSAGSAPNPAELQSPVADSVIVSCPSSGDGTIRTSTTTSRRRLDRKSGSSGSGGVRGSGASSYRAGYATLFYRLLCNKLKQTGCCGISACGATGGRRSGATQRRATKANRRRRNQRSSRSGGVDAASPGHSSSIEIEISRRMMVEHINWFRLTFKSSKLEDLYCQIPWTASKSNIVYILISWLLMALVSLISTPDIWNTLQTILFATIPLLAFACFYMSDSILYSKYMKYKLKEASQPSNQQRTASTSKRLSSQTSSSMALKDASETTRPSSSSSPAPAGVPVREDQQMGSANSPLAEPNASRPGTTTSEGATLLDQNQKHSSISTSVSYASGQNQKVAPLVHRVAKFWSKLDRIPMIWNVFIFIFNLIMTVAILHMNFFRCKLSPPHSSYGSQEVDSIQMKPLEREQDKQLTCLHEDNLTFGIILIMIEMGCFFRSSYLKKVGLLTSMTIFFMLFFYWIGFNIQRADPSEASNPFPSQTVTWSMLNVAYDHSVCPLATIDPIRSATNMSYLLAHTNLLAPYSLTSISQCDPNLIEKNYIILAILLIGLVYVCRSTERISRLDFLWKLQASKELKDMRDLRHHNAQLLQNILPDHVADHFLKDERNSDELYAQSYPCVAVLFASIPNFSLFYSEDVNNGMECIRLLNEIIFDFDQLLEDEHFKSIEKVKTISSTYLAACGLNPRDKDLPPNYHLSVCCKFAFAMKKALDEVNVHSFNNFVMRIGISHGPIVGGVIGAKKPVFDIWGDTVNEASRMDSTGTMDMIQVPKRSADILEKEGFLVQYRGSIAVKGKGNMETCFVLGDKPATKTGVKPGLVGPSPVSVNIEQETRFNVQDNLDEANTNSAIGRERLQPDEAKSGESDEPRTSSVVVKIMEPKQDDDEKKSSLMHRRFNRLSSNTQSLREPGGRSGRHTNKHLHQVKQLQVNRCNEFELAGLQVGGKSKIDSRHLSSSWGHNRQPHTADSVANHSCKESSGRIRSVSPIDLGARRQSGFASSILEGLTKRDNAGPSNTEEGSLAAVVFNMVQMRKNYEPLASNSNSTTCNSSDLTNQAAKLVTDTINNPTGGLTSGASANKLSIGRPRASTRKSAKSRASMFRKRSNYRRAGTSEVVDYKPNEESIHENE